MGDGRDLEREAVAREVYGFKPPTTEAEGLRAELRAEREFRIRETERADRANRRAEKLELALMRERERE